MNNKLQPQAAKMILGCFTQFTDLHTGDLGQKLGADNIYIECEKDKAIAIFKAVFGIDPNHCSCPCCSPSDFFFREVDNPVIKDKSFVVTKDDIERLQNNIGLSIN